MDNASQLLRTGEARKLLGISGITLYRWIRSGVIPAYRLPSGEYRISKDDIELLLTHGRLTSKKPKRRSFSPLK